LGGTFGIETLGEVFGAVVRLRSPGVDHVVQDLKEVRTRPVRGENKIALGPERPKVRFLDEVVGFVTVGREVIGQAIDRVDFQQ
jgi:hypothetical protein